MSNTPRQRGTGPRRHQTTRVPKSRWKRYVAIGDSSTEGLDDPDGNGGYRGWADRLAEHIAAGRPGFEYANLAIRGKNTAQIKNEQMPAALALRPNLVTVVAGMNDILHPAFHAATVAADVEEMFRTFTDAGVTVLSLTLPDPTPNLPLARIMGPRLAAFNDELRGAAHRTGVILVELGTWEHGSDPRLWSDDRLHGNARGHALVAHALAHGLDLPGFDGSWRDPLPPADPPGGGLALANVKAELAWAQGHALPWLWRTVRGRSAGDGLEAKRPVPEPVIRNP
jgi:lysophospholipase L1-like esterase